MATAKKRKSATAAALHPDPGRRVKVFLSYAHRDERLRDELDKHLSPLKRSALIEAWHDRQILPGTDLHSEIDLHLESADLILLLLSPAFIRSDYCYQKEMQVALTRHVAGTARIIPIILRPVDWTGTPVGKLLALPKDGKPVINWQRKDDALLDIAKGVRRVVNEILA